MDHRGGGPRGGEDVVEGMAGDGAADVAVLVFNAEVIEGLVEDPADDGVLAGRASFVGLALAMRTFEQGPVGLPQGQDTTPYPRCRVRDHRVRTIPAGTGKGVL
ncbi:MAG: hypothetical protein AMXMBFR64_54930 [Myxococcales bacterium]